MPPNESLRLSKRTWVLLGIWTVAGIVVGIVGDDELAWYLGLFWLLGLLVIIFLSEVIGESVRDRRETRAFVAEQEKRGRRF